MKLWETLQPSLAGLHGFMMLVLIGIGSLRVFKKAPHIRNQVKLKMALVARLQAQLLLML